MGISNTNAYFHWLLYLSKTILGALRLTFWNLPPFSPWYFADLKMGANLKLNGAKYSKSCYWHRVTSGIFYLLFRKLHSGVCSINGTFHSQVLAALREEGRSGKGHYTVDSSIRVTCPIPTREHMRGMYH